MPRLLILVPTEMERRGLEPMLASASGQNCRVDLCGFGPVAAAARTAQLLAEHAPKRVLLVGIAGRLDDRLAIGAAYRFERVSCYGIGVLEEIRGQVEAVAKQFQAERFNYLLLNRYRSGSDSMGWHADDEPEMGPVIASVSLGAPRNFRIRHTISRETRAFSLTSGSLLIMAGSMQQFWQHAIPKTKRPVGERINLTFRTLVAP